jgi:quinoprotein glucose dehydrogenase
MSEIMFFKINIKSNVLAFILSLFLISCFNNSNKQYKTWEIYGGSKENTHYSSLNQIDTNNVSDLQVAWVHHTGDADTIRATQIEVNPIIIDNILYGVSPKLKLFALDAATGKQNWSFDPLDTTQSPWRRAEVLSLTICRGIAFYKGNDNDSRIFYTVGSSLYCINAQTGIPVVSFGDSGRVDLHNDLGRNVKDLEVSSTSPGIIYGDNII